jgi:hypothetical protein
MSTNGKGSKPRPYSISYNKYCENFDSIFRKNKPKDKTIYDSRKKKQKVTPTDCHKVECELFILDQNKKSKK